MTAYIRDNKLYVNQAGDSMGVLLSKDGDFYRTTVLSEEFNAKTKKEQTRLKKEFKREKDIVVC